MNSRLEEPQKTTRTNPVITHTQDLLDLTLEERDSQEGYRTLIVRHGGRHIVSMQLTKADGKILYDLGVSGFLSLEDLARYELGIQIVRKKANEWISEQQKKGSGL